MDSLAFRYVHIDQQLVDDIFDAVMRGDAAVVLGAPWMGRSVLVDELRRYAQGQGRRLHLVDLRQIAVRNQKDVDALAESLHERADVVWIEGIDQVPQLLARALVMKIRELNQELRRGVVLSGHSDFEELVYGENSIMDCGLKVVIQGLGHDLFVEKCIKFGEAAGFTIEPRIATEIWELTGGHTYLLRLVVWSLIERRAREGPEFSPSEPGDVERTLEGTRVLAEHSDYLLQTFLRIIPRNRRAWPNLEKLLAGESPKLNYPSGQPGPLTLGGIAKRKDGHLVWASPIMERFVKEYMNGIRFADLFATCGDWREAFARFETLAKTGVHRPFTASDSAKVGELVNLLCLAIRHEGVSNPSYALQLAIMGCRYLLGFQNATHTSSGKEHGVVEVVGVPADLVRFAKEQTVSTIPRSIGNLELPGSWKHSGFAWALPQIDEAQRTLLLVGDFDSRNPLSDHRRRGAESLASALQDVWEHVRNARLAPGKNSDAPRSPARKAFRAGLASYASHTGPLELLRICARELRAKNYSRVLFCLVTPDGRRIKGAHDDSDDPTVDVAIKTNYLIIDDRDKDLQPWVVYNKRQRIVPDARTEPLANPLVVDAAKQRGLAIFPLFDSQGEVVGTLHVEREDGEAPSSDEARELQDFADEIGILIAEGKKLQLLQSTIDRIGDPIVICDLKPAPVYINPAAANWMHTASGWVEPKSTLGDIDPQVADALRQATRSGRKFKRPFFKASDQPRHGSILGDCLVDGSDNRIGGFVDIHDQKNLYYVFDCLKNIVSAANEAEIVERVFETYKNMGHKWGRRYAMLDVVPDQLVGRQSFGFSDSAVRDQFARGEINLGTRETHPSSWRCLTEKTYLVLRQVKFGETEGEEHTKLGVPVRVVNENCDPRVGKLPGSYWIDLPIIFGQREMGKFTLHCEEDIPPDRLELLNILSQIAAVALATLRDREKLERDHDRTVREAAEKSIAVVSHSLGTRLAGLSLLWNRYCDRNRSGEPIGELNDEFREMLLLLTREIKHTKEMFKGVKPRRVPVRLTAILMAALRSHFTDTQFDVAVAAGADEVCVDPQLMNGMIAELCQNSKDATSDTRDLRVRITATPCRKSDGPWVQITYCDNGPGIPRELKSRIFDDFFSIRAKGDSGMGLGLTYVTRGVAAHGGRIWEDGEPGSGARFNLVIPVGEAQ